MKKLRMLAIVPDPAVVRGDAGGALAASQVLFGSRFKEEFDVRIVDTTMRAFPIASPGGKIAAGARRLARTVEALRDWSPDIALAFCSEGTSLYEKSALLLLAKRAGARAFLSPRSGYAERWLHEKPWARRWVGHVGRAIDGFVVQSRAWRDIYRNAGVPDEHLFVWNNPVDTGKWAPVAERRRPRPLEEPFRFLFMAWAVAEKGLPELVEAATLLRAIPGPPFVLAVAGDGQIAKELRERRARGLLPTYIELLGWVVGGARVDQLRDADALVLPTHAEGFPNVVLEAMACGLPVLTTPVGAIPEIVVDGETGILSAVGSVNGLVEAMDWMRRKRDRAWEMGQRGLFRARTNFDQESAVEHLAAILRPPPELHGEGRPYGDPLSPTQSSRPR